MAKFSYETPSKLAYIHDTYYHIIDADESENAKNEKA